MTVVALVLFLLCAIMLALCAALIRHVGQINADSKRNLDRAEIYYLSAKALLSRVLDHPAVKP